MDMDAVDIGGASRMGVPTLPPARDADGSDDDEGELLTLPMNQIPVDLPAALQKAVAPGASIAYPSEHPAAAGDLRLDSDGRLIVPKGKTVTRSLLERPRDVSKQPDRTTRDKQLDELLAEENDEPAGSVARSAKGLPVIEVVFQTDIGAIVSYFHKVVQQGQWLILVSDNTAPAQAKFIPMPRKNLDGSHLQFDLIVTGADKRSNKLKATPLGIQFTVDTYDFIVMMLEDSDGEA